MSSSSRTLPVSVLLVTNTFPSDDEPGATPCVKDQIDALREDFGVAVDVVVIDRRRKLNYLKAALKMLFLNLRPRRYDLVHAHYGHSAFVARLQYRYPLVVTFHGCDLLSPREGAFGRWMARRVDAVIVMSEEMKRVSKCDSAVVIPFGVDSRCFFATPQAEARARLGLAQERKYVLFPYDQDRPVKRYDVLSAALERLKKRGEDVEVVVVHDQPRERVRDFMNAVDVMVLTSDREGSPMAVREALVCGLPVVSVDVGDIAELIHGIDGCYLARQEPEDLADKVAQVFARNRRLDVAESGRSLDAASAALKVLGVYRQLLEAGRASASAVESMGRAR